MLGFIVVMLLIGLVAGFIARALVPGNDHMGIVATIVLGIVGSFVGGLLADVLFRSDAEDVGMRVIGVGFDGSGAAREALDIAADLAVHNGATLRVYAVAPRLTTHPGALESQPQGVPSKAEKLREQLHDAVAELSAEARALPVFLWGAPSIELVAAAENGVDIMVLGSRGGGRMQRALYGSVSGTVIQEAPCPMLISPIRTATWISGGNFNKRIKLAMVLLSFPILSATLSCVKFNSSIIRLYLSEISIALRSSLCKFSSNANSSSCASFACRT